MKRVILTLIVIIFISGCVSQTTNTTSSIPDEVDLVSINSSEDEIPCCPACPEGAYCEPCHAESVSCD
jgi:PBP1b-binding outer membrane lipoprotein LpoB